MNGYFEKYIEEKLMLMSVDITDIKTEIRSLKRWKRDITVVASVLGSLVAFGSSLFFKFFY